MRFSNTHGFAALVKKGALHQAVRHCFLGWHTLATKTVPAILKGFLSTALKVVSFIRARVLNHCLFKKHVKKMEREHKVHLYYLEVCQLPEHMFQSKKFKRKQAHPQNNFTGVLGGLTYLGAISGCKKEYTFFLYGPVVSFLIVTINWKSFCSTS